MRAASTYELDQAQGNTEAYVEGLETGIAAVKDYVATGNTLNVFNLRRYVFPKKVVDSITIDDNLRLAELPDGPNGHSPVGALWSGWRTGVICQVELETGEKIE